MVAAGVTCDSLEEVEASLEDVFMAVATGGSLESGDARQPRPGGPPNEA